MPKRAYIKVILLLLLLIGSTIYATYIAMSGWNIFVSLLVVLIVALFYLIVRSYSFSANKVAFMFNAIENDDFTFRFTGTHKKISSDAYLNESLNRIKQLVLNARIEARERELYFETILERVSTGIVVINDDGIVFRTNKEALKLLQLSQLTHTAQLSVISPSMSRQFLEIGEFESRTIRFFDDASEVTLSMAATMVELQGRMLKVITLTDIASDIGGAELDSWSRMSRVLTHEIMNSLAPITSLSETLLQTTDPETTKRGLELISSTAVGLKNFVENYRSLTRVPAPKLVEEDIVELVRSEVGLFYPDVEIRTNAMLSFINIDRGLILQVIVNLLKNGVEVIEHSENADARLWIEIGCNSNGRPFIDICNNGTAVTDDIRDNMFVPFFTTKSGGSGIGLSLSRQIMRLHQGTLTLSTKLVTRFRMQF